MATVTQKKFLDDMISVCDTHGIPLVHLTRDDYSEYGHHSHVTGYKLFETRWREIVDIACRYVNGCFEADTLEPVVVDLPPVVEVAINNNPSHFSFDLLSSLAAPETVRTSLNPPKIFTFKVCPGDLLFFVPDMHAPFVDRGWLVWAVQTILDARGMGNRIHVIQTGDAKDLYGLGNYEKNNSIDPRQEIEAAAKPIKQFWEIMTKEGFACYQLIGNHDVRSEKYVRKHAPSLMGFVPTAKEMLTFPNVFTVNNERDCLLFESGTDQALTMHGYLSQSIEHVRKHGCNVIHSHLHRGGLNFFNGFFALDAGFGGNPEDWVFAYTNSILRKEWNLGMGMVEVNARGFFQPHFLRFFKNDVQN